MPEVSLWWEFADGTTRLVPLVFWTLDADEPLDDVLNLKLVQRVHAVRIRSSRGETFEPTDDPDVWVKKSTAPTQRGPRRWKTRPAAARRSWSPA